MTISKNFIYAAIACLITFGAGLFTGVNYLAPALTQYHYTKETIVEKPTIVEGETKTMTETQIAYIPKETVVVKYIDSATGQETTQTQLEKTDIDAQIGKQEINVKVNGQEVEFKKTDDEQFVFEKNKIALTQKSEVTFDLKVEPPVIDKTKHWSVGIGYGSNGAAGKIDFPLKNNNIGGWIYADKKTGAGGISVRF